MRNGDADEDAFDTAAVDVFRHQFGNNELYRRFCESRGVAPSSISHWQDIPAAPADLFKHMHSDPTTTASSETVFTSSGSTQGRTRRSRHAVRSLATYRESALGHFRKMVLADSPGRFRVINLGPNRASHPQSSLACMFDWCGQEFGSGETVSAFNQDGVFDMGIALDAVADAAAGTAPTLILAVSSALTALLDAIRDSGTTFRLPADSRIVDTGGKKGSSAGNRVFSSKGMLKAVWRFLHVPAYLCVNEYGMTEMLSQFYDDALLSRHDGALHERSKVGPHWVRAQVVDPATLAPASPGSTGLLRYMDLANWDSISALQTLDLGHSHGRGFVVEGRAQDAQTRGCSQLLERIIG